VLFWQLPPDKKNAALKPARRYISSQEGIALLNSKPFESEESGAAFPAFFIL
jgi:hypothetical protein